MSSLYASLPDVVRGLCSAEWVPLADHVRQEDQHTCMFCKQWLARPAYLTRHIAAQHAGLREVLDALPSWLQARRPTVFSPCRWCHQDFKVQHSSRSRHAQACTTLIRTGIYLLLELVSIFFCTVPIRSSPSAAAMELSAESQAELISAQGASDPPPRPHGSPTWCSSWGGPTPRRPRQQPPPMQQPPHCRQRKALPLPWRHRPGRASAATNETRAKERTSIAGRLR